MRDITELEELHQIETDILTAIDEICRKENIRYYLAGGTLLEQCVTRDLFRGTMISISQCPEMIMSVS